MLTAKQEHFAISVVEGRTQAAAYREAYDAEGMQDPTVWTEASKLMRHPQVSQRVEELREEAEAARRAVLMSREEAILQRLEHEAMTAKTDTARIRALELLGRHIGMFKDRVEVEQVDRSPEEIEAAIRGRLAKFGLLEG